MRIKTTLFCMALLLLFSFALSRFSLLALTILISSHRHDV